MPELCPRPHLLKIELPPRHYRADRQRSRFADSSSSRDRGLDHQAMEYTLTGLIGCFLFWALGIVPFRFPVAFSGFTNDTPWFCSALCCSAPSRLHPIGDRASASLFRHAAGRRYLSASHSALLLRISCSRSSSRPEQPASSSWPPIAIGLAEAFARRQCRAQHVPGPQLHRQYLRQNDPIGVASITAAAVEGRRVEVLWSYWFIAFLPCGVDTVLTAVANA